MAAQHHALQRAASASSLPFAAVHDDVPTALLRAATAGLLQRSDAPFNVSFTGDDVALAQQLKLLDDKVGGARLLYGTAQTGVGSLEEEMLRDLRADADLHDVFMTPDRLFRSTQTRSPSPHAVGCQDASAEVTRIDASASREAPEDGTDSDSADAHYKTPGRARAASSRKRNTPGTQRSESSGGRRASGIAKKAAKRVRRTTASAAAAVLLVGAAAAAAASDAAPAAVLIEAFDEAAAVAPAPAAAAAAEPYRFTPGQDAGVARMVEKYRLKDVRGENVNGPMLNGKSKNGIPWTDINRAILAGECPELRGRVCNAASHVLSKRWWILCPADCRNRERIMH